MSEYLKNQMNKVFVEHEITLNNDDQLPFVEPIFIDRLFMMFSVEDIVTLYTALLFE